MAKVYLEDSELTAIGNAIRTKNGATTLYLPSEMPAAINAIQSGGGESEIEKAVLKIQKNAYYGTYLFANRGWNGVLAVMPAEPLKLSMSGGCSYCFYANTGITSLPFTLIDMDTSATNASGKAEHIFDGCSGLKHIPPIKFTNVSSIAYFFSGCYALEEIPEMTYTINRSYLGTLYVTNNNVFQNCRKIKEIPESWMNLINQVGRTNDSNVSSGNFWGYQGFYYCHNLRKVENLWTPQYTSSMSASRPFDRCSMISKITFDPTLTRSWTSGTWDLSVYLGYFASSSDATNAGLTTATQVKDATTYASLKNNPDYWTLLPEYSRFNRVSAAETLASLPTVTKATIKFKGNCGSATDGGAISNLSDEEIAVATAKGWTVTLA